MYFITYRFSRDWSWKESLNSFVMDNKTSEVVAKWFEHKYAEVDQQMLPLSNKCKRKCDWCCYQLIEILNWEKPLILNYISESLSANQKIIVKKHLSNWLEYFIQKMGDKETLCAEDVFVKFQQGIASDKIACPFLNQHECLIYLVRPLSCRMHVAEKGPTSCKANPLNDASSKAINFRKNIIEDIVKAVPTRLELLNMAVAPLFGLNTRIKKIDYPLLQV